MIQLIAEKTGWSYHYILHRMSWINIRMMLADAPGYRYDRSAVGNEAVTDATDSDLRTLANTINGK
ncbi:hypothetical protein [uncultured Rikenella sp.]|uniref:hypothetical protein n=1 Tax=uncultured Rikenella sp. TaxID=368003 RepID=UPI002629BC89|nr:hypothetical protein [uncultured Rikenella sp.]